MCSSDLPSDRELTDAWLTERIRAIHAAGWDDRHRLWLAGGILVSHTAFMIPASVLSVFLGLLTIGLELALLIAFGRRLRQRGLVGSW